jgi:hypothetical protein
LGADDEDAGAVDDAAGALTLALGLALALPGAVGVALGTEVMVTPTARHDCRATSFASFKSSPEQTWSKHWLVLSMNTLELQRQVRSWRFVQPPRLGLAKQELAQARVGW